MNEWLMNDLMKWKWRKERNAAEHRRIFYAEKRVWLFTVQQQHPFPVQVCYPSIKPTTGTSIR